MALFSIHPLPSLLPLLSSCLLSFSFQFLPGKLPQLNLSIIFIGYIFDTTCEINQIWKQLESLVRVPLFSVLLWSPKSWLTKVTSHGGLVIWVKLTAAICLELPMFSSVSWMRTLEVKQICGWCAGALIGQATCHRLDLSKYHRKEKAHADGVYVCAGLKQRGMVEHPGAHNSSELSPPLCLRGENYYENPKTSVAGCRHSPSRSCGLHLWLNKEGDGEILWSHDASPVD